MTTPTELVELFGFHPDTPRIAAYGQDAAIVREAGSPATAIAILVQLLRPNDKTPSDKRLYLQVQPVDALNIAASILSHALEKDWPMSPDLLDLVERTRLPAHKDRH